MTGLSKTGRYVVYRSHPGTVREKHEKEGGLINVTVNIYETKFT